MNKKKNITKLVEHFGFEKIIAALPQREVREALGLVTAIELATEMGLTYDELRWQLNSGSIPHPTHKLVRRCFYTHDEADAIKQAWQRKNKFGANG